MSTLWIFNYSNTVTIFQNCAKFRSLQVMFFRNKKCIAVCALKILACIKPLLAASLINISLAEINKVVFIAYKDSVNMLSFAGILRKGFWGSVLVWCFSPHCF